MQCLIFIHRPGCYVVRGACFLSNRTVVYFSTECLNFIHWERSVSLENFEELSWIFGAGEEHAGPGREALWKSR